METDSKTVAPANPPVSSLHRFSAYRDDGVDAETVATGCALIGMLCFACLLLVRCLDGGVLA